MEKTEQPTTDSKETTTTVDKVEPTQPNKEVAEIPENVFDDYEKEMERYIGATKKTDTKEDVIPAVKVEETQEVKTVTELPKKEESPTQESSTEVTDQSVLPEVKIEDLTFKRKGEEVPLMTVLQEFQKEGKLQEFVKDYTSKYYDYYSKTQEHSKTVKDFNASVEEYKQKVEILELKNLVNELGEANIKSKEYFENAVDKDNNVKYDDPEKAYKSYIADVEKRGQNLQKEYRRHGKQITPLLGILRIRMD